MKSSHTLVKALHGRSKQRPGVTGHSFCDLEVVDFKRQATRRIELYLPSQGSRRWVKLCLFTKKKMMKRKKRLDDVNLKPGMKVLLIALFHTHTHTHTHTTHNSMRIPAVVALQPYGDNEILMLDSDGGIRLFEFAFTTLVKSLDKWKQLIGEGSDKKRLDLERYSGLDVSKPKHGSFCVVRGYVCVCVFCL